MPQVHGKQMIDRRRVTTGTVALAGSLAAPRVVRAETAAEFYRGKTVRILVGSPPGGGYDIYARLVTPALAAKLGATVLVENKDGNGGLAALATLLVRPADGLTIMNGSAEAADPQPDAGAAGRDLGRHQAELARQTGDRRQSCGSSARTRAIRRSPTALQGRPADLVGDRAGRRHQRRPGDHLLCARAEVENRHRLSRLRRHVARRHPQRSRLRPAVGGLGAATHRFDQAAGGVRRQALVAICPMCRR